MSRWLCFVLHLLFEAQAARRDARIRFLMAQVGETLQPCCAHPEAGSSPPGPTWSSLNKHHGAVYVLFGSTF